MSCPLCQRVALSHSKQYPFLIHEFENSYLYLGEHQFYRGYCVLVTKEHFAEMTDIPQAQSEQVFKEMMKTHAVIEKVFQPKKMNLCSLGNVVPHVHWHFFPRYENDKNFTNPPWLQMHLFESAKINSQERDELIQLIRSELKLM